LSFKHLLNQVHVPTPIMELGQIHGVRLLVKRDDLIHEDISGNKWRKLKLNLQHCLEQSYEGIISFGGAFSNHIYSLSAACDILNLPFVAIIRGEEVNDNNSTLKVLLKRSQKVIKVTREEYQLKTESVIIQQIISKYKNYLIIPEGGTNGLAIDGMKELVEELTEQCAHPDYLVCSAGTFGTSAGILKHLSGDTKLMVYPALKGKWVHTEIQKLLPEKTQFGNLVIRDMYHFGGYGKGLIKSNMVINEMNDRFNLPLDPVYTAKAFAGMLEDIKAGYYKKGSTVIFYHSGGLQGVDVNK
jgi:1-aminocyclopropane-1-carboxylate deaminase